MTAPVAVALHAAALLLYGAASLVAPRRRGRLAAAGAALHAAGLGLWWAEVGHGPYLAPFEVLSADAWLVVAAYALVRLRSRPPAALDRVAYAAAAALLAVAFLARPQPTPLPLVMRSVWLVLHVTLYKLSFAALVLAVAASLVAARHAARGADGGEALPPALPYRLLGAAFALWTAGMLLGSTWGYDNRGSFWSWEAVEIFALVAWIVLGSVLHVHRYFEPGPRAQLWLHVACLVVAVFSLFAAPLLASAVHGGYLRT